MNKPDLEQAILKELNDSVDQLIIGTAKQIVNTQKGKTYSEVLLNLDRNKFYLNNSLKQELFERVRSQIVLEAEKNKII